MRYVTGLQELRRLQHMPSWDVHQISEPKDFTFHIICELDRVFTASWVAFQAGAFSQPAPVLALPMDISFALAIVQPVIFSSKERKIIPMPNLQVCKQWLSKLLDIPHSKALVGARAEPLHPAPVHLGLISLVLCHLSRYI